MTDLGRFTQRLAGNLSGGMKQKLGLACTLIGSPEVLLLDEPTVGVDPLSRRELWEIIARLVREQSLTVLMSTSYLDEAERCDQGLCAARRQAAGERTARNRSPPSPRATASRPIRPRASRRETCSRGCSTIRRSSTPSRKRAASISSTLTATRSWIDC